MLLKYADGFFVVNVFTSVCGQTALQKYSTKYRPITHGNTSNRNRSLILNSRFRDFYSVHKSEVEGTSLFTGACSVENRHKKSPTDSGKYQYIVYSAWAETWRRIWGGPKDFFAAQFQEKFPFSE